MMNKRDMALGLLAAGFAGAAHVVPAGAAAAGLTDEEAKAALMVWLGALKNGDPQGVAKVLAPEFQILRSDGSGFDHDGYLKALPKFSGHPEILDLAHSSGGGLLVARYMLRVAQKIGDKPVQMQAPRLSVLRQGPDGWLMVAHANFAQIG